MARPIDERTAGRLERVAPRVLKLFLGRQGTAEASGLEAGGAAEGPPGEADVRRIASILKSVNAARETTTSESPVAGREPELEADAIAARLVALAQEMLAELAGGRLPGALPADGAYALEAVLKVRGRPALRVEGDRIEPIDAVRHPGSDFWVPFFSDHEEALVAATTSTGAVMVSDEFGQQRTWVQGTAWVIGPGLVITNRHVLFPPYGTTLARRIPGEPTTARIKSEFGVAVDFTFDSRKSTKSIRCPVTGIAYVSAPDDPIDVAVLTIGPAVDGEKVPPSLTLSKANDDYSYLYVVGHPGKMIHTPKEVRAVFGDPDERKRVSFGETMDDVLLRAGELVYDISTIGGFSGGCVLPFMTHEVTALHYWGDPTAGNRGITAAALRAHAVARFL